MALDFIVLSISVALISVGSMLLSDESPIQELLMDDSEQMQQPTNNKSDDHEPITYHEREVKDTTDSEDWDSESGQQFNFSEKKDSESDLVNMLRT